MNHRIDLKETLLFLFRTILILGVLLVLGSNVLMTKDRFFSTQLDEGWSVKYGENQAENVTLSDFNFVDVHAGDVVTISNTNSL